MTNWPVTYSGQTCCHSPTQPQLELELSQPNSTSTGVELDLIMGRNPPHPPHPTPPTGTYKAPPDNLFGMQPYFDPNRKTTSKKMEDDLKKNKKIKDDLRKK